jgi:choline dehydrogenase-like flavoprotein
MSKQSTGPYAADVIIVGSGAGGAAAAYALAKRGIRILILEKGEELPRDGSTLDINRVVHRGEFLSREPWLGSRGERLMPEEHFNLGGKTKWYGAALLRFSPQEFDADLSYGARCWPLRYADMEPYYVEAERLLGVKEFPCEPDLQSILQRLSRTASAWQSSPLPLALAQNILKHREEAAHFDGFASASDLKGEAQSTFLEGLKALPNVHMRCDAEVVTLMPAGSGRGTVDGVQLRNGEVLRAKVIVMAAGALHSPRLLSRYVATSNPLLPAAFNIGRHLKLHLLSALVAVSPGRKSDLLRKTMLTVNERFPHSSVQPLGFDGELIGTLVPKFIPRFLARHIGARAYGFFLQTEDGSASANRVLEIPDAASGAVMPLLDYDENRVPLASLEHRRFVRAFRLSLLRASLPSFSRRIGLNGTAHACGTLIAGSDPRDSVVDARGAVFGVNGLYVADGSVLPRISRVNPSLSIYAWGLRVGTLLSQQLLRPAPEFRNDARPGVFV